MTCNTQQASHLLDIASCFVILFPIVWSIQQLKTEARSEAAAAAAAAAAEGGEPETSEAPAIREKLLQLRGFYSLVRGGGGAADAAAAADGDANSHLHQVVLFLYSTRILLYLVRCD